MSEQTSPEHVPTYGKLDRHQAYELARTIYRRLMRLESLPDEDAETDVAVAFLAAGRLLRGLADGQ